MTVEGENDDISGVGQTEAAHDLAVNIPAEKKRHHLQLGVGHYGVFNGSRFRNDIVPRLVNLIAGDRRSVVSLLRQMAIGAAQERWSLS